MAVTPLQKRLDISVGKKAPESEVARSSLWSKLAVVGHFRNMVATHGNIKPKFAVDLHQRELIRITLIVKQLGEIFLRSLYIANVDKGDTLAEMSGGTFESLDRINRIDRIIFNAEARNRRASGARDL